MTKEEKLELYMQMRRKKITMTDVAKELGLSCSSISQFINNRASISQTNVEKMVEFIERV